MRPSDCKFGQINVQDLDSNKQKSDAKSNSFDPANDLSSVKSEPVRHNLSLQMAFTKETDDLFIKALKEKRRKLISKRPKRQ